ncbi:glycosyltransferase [Cesiribacter andamanensis]|uniref:Glycosyl transferase n=1 Tax=Cesiribacter andamanensis AMV16 TaxID=1279009 RepID=M7NFZ7_9BACT|nr:nucleotide disphospho-sugar-binding domain-containing protein [Cesiribacter andamanensis]EMR00735.1 Glycosyl transferase [Cesiribacter andamanensis AMV16]
METSQKGGTQSPKPFRRILFANCPADGHFNPLIPLAEFLKQQGHDVRWYSSRLYADKISRMGIPHYPFKKALEFDTHDWEGSFPERSKHKSQVGKLRFDLEHVFIRRGPEYFEDIRDLHQEFPFDVLVAEISFTGIAFIRHLMHKPVIAVGIFPNIASSRDLPPYGLGMRPASGFLGRKKQDLLRFLTDKLVFGKQNELNRQILRSWGIEAPGHLNLFDLQTQHASVVLQNGTPGFEYTRSDLSPNLVFAGPLLPLVKKVREDLPLQEKLRKYKNVILVTQGTAEQNTEKILAPTLEAFKDSTWLVVATTGGAGTEALRARYPQENFLIEDYIPFDQIMPNADVYVSNGGFGGVLQAISHQLPMVVAGVHEGKNEICARVGYFKLGLDLKTETPKPAQIRAAVEQVLQDPQYRHKVQALSAEFRQYNPQQLCEHWVQRLTGGRRAAAPAPQSAGGQLLSLTLN